MKLINPNSTTNPKMAARTANISSIIPPMKLPNPIFFTLRPYLIDKDIPFLYYIENFQAYNRLLLYYGNQKPYIKRKIKLLRIILIISFYF